MGYKTLFCLMLLLPATGANAAVSIGIDIPGVSIGINLPRVPEMLIVPGYPVYYAPQSEANYFFYDGMYWVYREDDWYASAWYNGPWESVSRGAVPAFILRVPVRYYRQPPAYFRTWQRSAAPRWDEHWGHDWARGRRGWDKWDRRNAPRPAPLPSYQRQYSGDRYPGAEQQHKLNTQKYRYQPKERVVREHYKKQKSQAAITPPAQIKHQPAAPQRSEPEKAPRQSRQDAPRASSPERQPPQSRQAEAGPQRSQPDKQSRQQGERSSPPEREPAKKRAQSEQRERGQPHPRRDANK